MGELDGRVVVVTGGNRGIGRAIATAMADAGAHVAVGARTVDGCGFMAHECDVRDDDSMRNFADAIFSRWGRVDVVVANAGTTGPTGLLHEIEPAAWRDCIDTDLTGVFLTFRHFIPHLIDRRAGSLIALSSITGKRPLAGRTPYAAAKMGVIGLVRTLAWELGPYDIRVNSVCPGSVDGPRLDRVIAADAKARDIPAAEVAREHAEPSALKRLVRGEEVADACVFLASERASAVTGQDINVSAGFVMY